MAIEWWLIVKPHILQIVLMLARICPMFFSKLELKMYSEEAVLKGIGMNFDANPFNLYSNRAMVKLQAKNETYYSNIELYIANIYLKDDSDFAQGVVSLRNINRGEILTFDIPIFLDEAKIKMIRALPSIKIKADTIFNCNNRKITKAISIQHSLTP